MAGKKKRSTQTGETEAQPAVHSANFEPIEIKSHRGLITHQREIFRRLNHNPELAKRLLLNPVLAFREVGVKTTPKIAQHILRAIQFTPRLRARYNELQASLKEATGRKPRPNDPQWVSRFLFEELGLQPLDTAGHQPTYMPPLNAPALERLQALRPKRRQRYGDENHRPGKPSFLRVQLQPPAVRRFDLDAALPSLEPAAEPPPAVTREELYFYRDSHPLARDLLELGMIEQRSFRIQSSDSYRKIKDGRKVNAFHTWVKSVRFPEE